MKKIFTLWLFLAFLMSETQLLPNSFPTPFDKKVYLPGDFFEYIFEGRGPVPAIKNGWKEFRGSNEYEDKEESNVDAVALLRRRNEFNKLMVERFNYCVDNIDDETFLKKHASHCSIVAENLLKLNCYPFYPADTLKQISEYKDKFGEIKENYKTK